MESSTTRTPRMLADSTACGACINGSIAHRRGAMRRTRGGAVTTSTRTERRHVRDDDARTDVAHGRSIVPWPVGRDDGGDDAAVLDPDAAALSPGQGTMLRPWATSVRASSS